VAALEWYFDYISPFAYLQWRRMGELPAGVAVEHRPVLLAGLLGHWEARGPAEIAPKRVFTYRYVQWLAERSGVQLRMPTAHPFNPLPALRLTLALECRPEVIDRIFAFVWRDGGAVDDPAAWHGLARSLEVEDLDATVAAPAVKEALRASTDAAIARGAFGVPTFADGDLLFWGVDATDMLLDHLREPQRFTSDEYARIAELPVAARRV